MFDIWIRSWNTYFYPDENPIPMGPTSFDPLLGFNDRKERVMIATEEELRACKIPKDKWDFCAHKLIDLERCKFQKFPFVWRCKAESHDLSMCYLDDYILRMKEYEREKRLINRELQMKKKREANDD